MRFRDCCGRIGHGAEATRVDIAAQHECLGRIRRAGELLLRGESRRAAAALAGLQPGDVTQAAIALDTADILLECNNTAAALPWAKRAVDLSLGSPVAVARYDECCALLKRRETRQGEARLIGSVLARINARAGSPRHRLRERKVHIVGKLDNIGGSERRALNLYRTLSKREVPVTLWSTVAVRPEFAREFPVRGISPESTPNGGVLALISTYFDCPWLNSSAFERIVVCHNLADHNRTLLSKLEQIESNPAAPLVRLTFPSRMFRRYMDLPGQVQYSPVDLGHFRRQRPPARRERLAVGRHARQSVAKFHPNDPAFCRELLRRGYDVKLLGGAAIAEAFTGDANPLPQLLPVGDVDARTFLEGLDVFVYRKHPHAVETGGTTIMEAMAMSLPVIVFGEDCGIAELISDGQNGFLVDTEAQALQVLDSLRTDASLARRIGSAARETIERVMQQQSSTLTDFYLD